MNKIIYCIVGSCYKKAKWVMGRLDMCDEHRTQYNQWERSNKAKLLKVKDRTK